MIYESLFLTTFPFFPFLFVLTKSSYALHELVSIYLLVTIFINLFDQFIYLLLYFFFSFAFQH